MNVPADHKRSIREQFFQFAFAIRRGGLDTAYQKDMLAAAKSCAASTGSFIIGARCKSLEDVVFEEAA